MLDVKENNRGKYNDNKCRVCKTEIETQKHVLEECTKIHPDNRIKVTREEIFNPDTGVLKQTTDKIKEVMKSLTDCRSHRQE